MTATVKFPLRLWLTFPGFLLLISSLSGAAAQDSQQQPAQLPAQEQPTAVPSVIDRLSGFDQQRIRSVGHWLQAPLDAERLSEAAKLLYQVNRLSRTSLAAPPAGSAPRDQRDLKLTSGDAVTIRGTAISLAASSLPADLAEVLEIDRIYRVGVQTIYEADDAAEPVEGPKVYVLTSSVPAAWVSLWAESRLLDQPTAATGVVVQSDADGRPQVLATASMAWFPTAETQAAQDWALLASQGMNVSLLEHVRARDRKPLLAADHEAFYAMLKAANDFAAVPMPSPPEVDASELLRNASESVGRRLRMRCQSVRITRITLNNPSVRDTLGSDHYWQIDALGDLRNVIIRIEPADDETEPVTFQGRYPISIAALTLPDFLRDLVGADESAGAARSDVLLLSRQLTIDGFFYRLWSYESDFMRQRGGGNQFGPLLMATRIEDSELPAGDHVGVAMIGQMAAGATVVMLVAAGLWIYVTSRRDAAARERRRAEFESADWPAEPPDRY